MNTRKIVINKCYGGFGLSKAALAKYCKAKGIDSISQWEIARDDCFLVDIVESLKDKANGPHTNLKVVEIPFDVDWTVEEYDGNEWIAERHRTWS